MLKTKIPAHFSANDWKRLPKPRERLCDLSRTTLLELHERGEITIAALRKPGAQKAIRLVFMPSLFTYLNSCVEDSIPAPLKMRRSRSGNPALNAGNGPETKTNSQRGP
jgi:hypothetical protein